MEYRKIPETDDSFSVIGMGANYSWENMNDIPSIVEHAIESGVNVFDTVVQNERTFSYYKSALSNYERSKYKLQIHFGSEYKNNKYAWTRNLDDIKNSFDKQISLLGCEYADIGMIHCIDSHEDFDNVMENGLWEYMTKLQKDGAIKYLGCSTHNPSILRKFIATRKIKVAMFSINMVYDYLNIGNFAMGSLEDRYSLYKECEEAGIALTVMKPFAGKRLLCADLNSFGEAFSVTQCLQYALDRPAVISVLPGVANVNQLKESLHYCDATDEEKDYSKLYGLSKTSKLIPGQCVYCNHCQPCPAGLDIGQINKFYDLAVLGDEIAFNHYRNLDVKASACIKCGHCENVCPFHVKQSERMEKISIFFHEKNGQ